MIILLTAFNAFGDLPVNPSQVIVEEYLARQSASSECLIRGEVLETSYALAEIRIAQLLEEVRPDVLLMFGVAQKSPVLRVERQAINWDAASLPDNSGELRVGQPVQSEGPTAYSVTIPTDGLVEALRREAIPAELSDNAGAFVCNHTLYAALHHAQRLGGMTKCGFVHIPLPVELSTPGDPCGGVTIADLLRGVDACVKFLTVWQQGIGTT